MNWMGVSMMNCLLSEGADAGVVLTGVEPIEDMPSDELSVAAIEKPSDAASWTQLTADDGTSETPAAGVAAAVNGVDWAAAGDAEDEEEEEAAAGVVVMVVVVGFRTLFDEKARWRRAAVVDLLRMSPFIF